VSQTRNGRGPLVGLEVCHALPHLKVSGYLCAETRAFAGVVCGFSYVYVWGKISLVNSKMLHNL
jgi:hypothetical protein